MVFQCHRTWNFSDTSNFKKNYLVLSVATTDSNTTDSTLPILYNHYSVRAYIILVKCVAIATNHSKLSNSKCWLVVAICGVAGSGVAINSY